MSQDNVSPRTTAPRTVSTLPWWLLPLLLLTPLAHAELRLPALFSDHMVLQREMPVKVWGWDTPGQIVEVDFAGQTVEATADAAGRWTLTLSALETSSQGQTLRIHGSSKIALEDILVGEVWLCSGQSNMQFGVTQSQDGDLAVLTARYPNIRLITVPHVGTQTPQDDFDGQWTPATPESVPWFSAVGFYFGRTLHAALDVPIGLIHSSWGGANAEAWVERSLLESDPRYAGFLNDYANMLATYDREAELADWKVRAAKARAEGRRPPWQPPHKAKGQQRPSNLYNGMLKPLIGYGMRGCIWYQGEGNASRAYNYRYLFPLLISSWRKDWGIGDFSFYWVQLADFRAEDVEPGLEVPWALVWESQTHALALPKTGQAVIYDLGEGNDIHPRNKHDVAARLARHALAKDYGFDLVSESPRYQSHERVGERIRITFDHVGGGLRAFDTDTVQGFAIAGEDKAFVWAKAAIVDQSTIEVWASEVTDPVAVRYAWASNPVANVRSEEGLLLTPFRTDTW